jgi:hypothetical protein
MTLIQFKLNNYDYSSKSIEQVKDYIKNEIFPEYVKTNYKRKLYENKWLMLEFSELGFIGKLFRTRYNFTI